MKISSNRVAALLFMSGLSALVYQTAWQRSLRLIFGASTAASAAVLAVFLGGLGLGGVLLGRRAEQSARPLVFYGNLELGVAATAALSPFLIGWLGKLYVATGGVAALGHVTTAVRLFIAAVAVGPSVLLMGGTLPAAARAAEEEGDRARSRLALLYAANALGAVLGALFGTFFLFELFGTRLSLWTAVLINALAGMLARGLGRSTEVPVKADDASPEGKGRAPIHACVVAAGVGFAFLLLEVVWYRLLAPILGGTTYTFGLILAVALAGIGLGGLLYAQRGENRPATLSDLALTTTLEGVFVALPYAAGDRIAIYAALTRPLSSLGFPALVASWVSVTVLVVLPASIASGYQFPLLFALLGEGRTKVARQVGTLYGWNTVGSIVGSLIGGLYLIPWLGAVGCLRLVAASLVVLGLATAALDFVKREQGESLGAWPAALAVLGVIFLTRTGPTAVWRHEPIGAGRASPPVHSRNALRAWMMLENSRVVWQRDGVETAVALKKADELVFVVDGKTDGSTFGDRATQVGSALIGALVHPAPRRAFVIGLGTGMTAGWLGAVPGMEHVDVAELEPSIVEVARAAAAANHGVLSQPNVQLHFGDGRELLLTSKSQYDIVASEPSNPYRAGVTALYTQEFYQAVRSRLRQGGLFVQWVQGYEVDTDTIRTIVRTLRSVFAHVDAWQTQYGDILFLASSEPRVFDVEQIRARARTEPFHSGLVRSLYAEDVEGLLGHYLANELELAKIAEQPGVPLNTDDQNALDYAFGRSVGANDGQVPLQLLNAAASTHRDRPETRGDVDWARVAELRSRPFILSNGDLPLTEWPSHEAFRRIRAVALGCDKHDDVAAIGEWAQQPLAPRDAIEQFVVGFGLAGRGDPRAADLANALANDAFTAEADVVRARLALHGSDPDAALSATLAALDGFRHQGLPICGATTDVLKTVKELAKKYPQHRRALVEALLGHPFAAFSQDELRRTILESLVATLDDPNLCVRALDDHVEYPIWDQARLDLRYRCLAGAAHPKAERARQDLLEFADATVGML